MVVRLNAAPSSHVRPFRFSRQSRLKSPRTIRQIMQDGASLRRRFGAFRLVCLLRPDVDERESPRFAFVVSRSAGPAVVRNRIKRRLREAVRLQRLDWPKQTAEVIIRVNEGQAADLPFGELKAQIHEALSFINESHTRLQT